MVRHGKQDGSKQKRNAPNATPEQAPAKKQKKQKKRAGSEKKKDKPTHRRGSLMEAIIIYMDKVGYDKVTYDVMLKIALKAKPDTKFNHSHYSWYRNKYRQMRGIE